MMKVNEIRRKFKERKILKCLGKKFDCIKCRKLINGMNDFCKQITDVNIKNIRKLRNKVQHALNGNIKNVIKLTCWNKGNGSLAAKMEQIKVIVKNKKPDIFIVTVLELDMNDDINITNINGYDFEVDKLMEKMALDVRECGSKEILYMKELKN